MSYRWVPRNGRRMVGESGGWDAWCFRLGRRILSGHLFSLSKWTTFTLWFLTFWIRYVLSENWAIIRYGPVQGLSVSTSRNSRVEQPDQYSRFVRFPMYPSISELMLSFLLLSGLFTYTLEGFCESTPKFLNILRMISARLVTTIHDIHWKSSFPAKNGRKNGE